MELEQSDRELRRCSRDFDPTAEELIGYYLKNHILRYSYPESGIIQRETVYGEDIDPWDKFCDPRNPYPWSGDSTPTLFLFTKLSDVGNTEKSCSVQKNRKTGSGTWHGSSSVINVTSSADEKTVIGHYKILSFRSANGGETDGQWIMYEYSISGEAFPEIRQVKGWQNQVVCRIKRDDSKSNIGGKVTKRTSKRKSSPKRKPISPNKRKSSLKPVSNKRRRTASSGEEEKPVAAVEFVNPEPAAQGYCGQFPESTEEFYFDVDEIFAGVECE